MYQVMEEVYYMSLSLIKAQTLKQLPAVMLNKVLDLNKPQFPYL